MNHYGTPLLHVSNSNHSSLAMINMIFLHTTYRFSSVYIFILPLDTLKYLHNESWLSSHNLDGFPTKNCARSNGDLALGIIPTIDNMGISTYQLLLVLEGKP